jgi:hypothetical protein
MFLSQWKKAMDNVKKEQLHQVKLIYHSHMKEAYIAFKNAFKTFIEKTLLIENPKKVPFMTRLVSSNSVEMEYSISHIMELKSFSSAKEVFETFGKISNYDYDNRQDVCDHFADSSIYINKISEGTLLKSKTNDDNGIFHGDLFETMYLPIISETINKIMKENGIDTSKFKFDIEILGNPPYIEERTKYYCYIRYEEKVKFDDCN